MELAYIIIICVLAGAGAGVVTGFAGLSAAAFISPMLVSLLGVPAFEAIGIALASDVLASAISSISYFKRGNHDLKRALPLMISVLVFSIAGSVVSYFLVSNISVGDELVGYLTVIGMILIGFKFIFRPVKESKIRVKHSLSPVIVSIISGAIIGFICGFQGVGGGLWMLLTLNIILNFDFKKAVGTSLFIMTFTALIGAGSHFVINGFPNYIMLIICVVVTLVVSKICAHYANKTHSIKVNKLTGYLIVVSGIFMMIMKVINHEYNMMTYNIIIVSVLAVIFILIVILEIYGHYFLRFTIFSKNYTKKYYKDVYYQYIDKVKELKIKKHETIKVIDDRGITLKGELYLNHPENQKLVILLSPYKINALFNASIMYEFYDELGYNIFVPYHIASGKSHGYASDLGLFGSENLTLWINKLKEKYDFNHIVIHGRSLGAFMALKNKELAALDVKLIIADQPYSEIDDILKKKLGFLYHFDRALHRLASNQKFKDVELVSDINQNKVPTIFMISENDELIPSSMGQELYELSECEKYLKIFNDTNRHLAISKYQDEYFSFIKDKINHLEKNTNLL